MNFNEAMEKWVEREFQPKMRQRVLDDLREVFTGNRISTMPVYQNYYRAILIFQKKQGKSA